MNRYSDPATLPGSGDNGTVQTSNLDLEHMSASPDRCSPRVKGARPPSATTDSATSLLPRSDSEREEGITIGPIPTHTGFLQHVQGVDGEETLNQVIGEVHSKAKHTCGLCGKSFGCKGNLNVHINGVHGKGRYKCGRCDKRFRRKSQRDSHIKSAHDVATLGYKRWRPWEDPVET